MYYAKDRARDNGSSGLNIAEVYTQNVFNG